MITEVHDNQQWFADTVAMVDEQGYRVTPVFKSGKCMPYGDNQTYPDVSDYKTAVAVGVVLDECVLLDWDGNHADDAGQDIIDLETLAATLGLEAMPECVQEGSRGRSLHFLFSRGERDVQMASSDGWLDFVDIKTANQLMILKPHKSITGDELPAKADLSPCPEVLLEALSGRRTGGLTSVPNELALETARDDIRLGINLHASARTIANAMIFDGKTEAEIYAHFRNDLARDVEQRGSERLKVFYGGELQRLVESGFCKYGDRVASLAEFEAITDGVDSLPTHSFADLAGRDIPPREWVIASTIPSGCVTSLYGIGGEGKTLISMQMAQAVSTGYQFMGQDVSRGPVLMMLNEDDTDEVGRRVQRLGANAPDVHVIDFHAVTDPCLMRFTRDGSAVTQTGAMLEATIERYAPKLVVLDPISFIFCGNENDRAEVGTFVRHMNQIASRQRTAIVMIGHPSKDQNSEYSGSTSWSNSVRSRLELKKVEKTDNEYRLFRHKSNYAPKDEEGLHMVKTDDGVFKSADLFDLEGEKKRQDQERREDCDALARDFIRHQTKTKGKMPTQSTGPTSLARMIKAIWPDWGDVFTATELADSMTRLEQSGFIKKQEYTDSSRHKRTRFVLAEVTQ